MVGGRLGYLMTPDTLLFGSAGYANAGLDDTNLRAGLDFGGQNVISESTVFSAANVSQASLSVEVPKRESTIRSPLSPNTVILISEVKI